MRKLIVVTLAAVFSVVALAGHHEGGTHGMKHPSKGMFKRADLDGDGVISGEEHEKALAEMTERRREHFAEMDADGDGSLSKEEAKAGMEERKEEMQERRKEMREKRSERDKMRQNDE